MTDHPATQPSMNQKRVEWAEEAVNTFAERTWGQPFAGSHPEDREAMIYDLLADIMHLCAVEALDVDELVEHARMHYMAELHGDD